MGFLQDLGEFIGEVQSLGEELKDTATGAIQDVTSIGDELKATKDEIVSDIAASGSEIRTVIEDFPKK